MNKIEEKCCMYIDLIHAMGRDSLLEPKRAELHNEICDMIGIPHNSTKHITGDLIGVSGRALYSKILELKEDLKIKSKKEVIIEELNSYRETWGSKTRFTEEESAKIWNKLSALNCSVFDEDLRFIIEMSITELEIRHRLVFGSEAYMNALMRKRG